MQVFQTKNSRKECEECGGYPVNHTIAKVNTTIDTILSTFGSNKWMSSFLPFITRLVHKLTYGIWPTVSKIALTLHIVSYNTDLEKVRDSRLRMIWEEARRRAIPMRQLSVFGTFTEIFEAHIGSAWRPFYMFPIPMQYSADMSWPDDKFLLKEKLLQERIASPRSFNVSTFSEACRVLDQLGIVCVKPRNGSNGRHTFPHVSKKSELQEAFQSAKKLGHWVVVEEHLEGNLVRATCVGGVLIGFLECESPTVMGDGYSTIRTLIERKNEERGPYTREITITSVHEKYIMRRGYTLDSVLDQGEKLPLTFWAGFGSGGRNWERGTDIHPQLRSEIERAARLTQLPVVGFDVIIEDAYRAPEEQVWGIIEANSVPWIDIHTSPKYEKSIHVGAAIWDLWDDPVTSTLQGYNHALTKGEV